jgi:hypothetical protein
MFTLSKDQLEEMLGTSLESLGMTTSHLNRCSQDLNDVEFFEVDLQDMTELFEKVREETRENTLDSVYYASQY